jgi:hypothetical protein
MPPELPGLIAASVWIISSINVPASDRIVRPRELTIPVVNVLCRPKGFPIAGTFWPIFRFFESPLDDLQLFSWSINLDHCQVIVRIRSNQFRRPPRTVCQSHLQLLSNWPRHDDLLEYFLWHRYSYRGDSWGRTPSDLLCSSKCGCGL